MIDWYQKVRGMSVVHQTDAAVADQCLARRRHSHHVACPGWQPTRCVLGEDFLDSWQLSGRASRAARPAACSDRAVRAAALRGLARHGFLEINQFVGDSNRGGTYGRPNILWGYRARASVMAAPRRVSDLAIGEEELAELELISGSRTEPAGRVCRARMLLAYREDPSFFAVGVALGVHHQTVQRCVARAITDGALVALENRARPGREPVITQQARAWLIDLACRKAKELGYPHEVWTTRLLAQHARQHGPAAGNACLADLSQGTVCKILDVARSAAQGALLPGAPRPRVRGENGLGAVRLSRGQAAEEANQVCRQGRDRDRAGRAGDRRDRTGLAGLLCPAFARLSLAIMNTSATVPSACWLVSTC